MHAEVQPKRRRGYGKVGLPTRVCKCVLSPVNGKNADIAQVGRARDYARHHPAKYYRYATR
jgi:hypothetical protein